MSDDLLNPDDWGEEPASQPDNFQSTPESDFPAPDFGLDATPPLEPLEPTWPMTPIDWFLPVPMAFYLRPPLQATDPQLAAAGPGFGRRLWQATRDVLETIVPAVIIALLINFFLAQATRVYGQSMEPNLHTDQRLVVEKVSYRFQEPHRGDVVVLKVREDSKELLIKRVIGLAGETVEVHDGEVFVDGAALNEPYLSQATRGHYGPTIIPEDNVFVMGDNRGASNDSRSFGPIPLENIIGKAWVSYWPPEDIGLVE